MTTIDQKSKFIDIINVFLHVHAHARTMYMRKL